MPSGQVPHPSRRGMTMDRGGPTRRAAGRVAGGADPERVGPCPRGVRARGGRVARRGRVARFASARAPERTRATPTTPESSPDALVFFEKKPPFDRRRTHLRSRCPPAEPSKRRASRCPASRTEPVPREGGLWGNQNVGWSAAGPPPAADARRKRDDSANTVCLAENRDATPSVSSGRCRAPRRRRDRGKSSMGSFDVP